MKTSHYILFGIAGFFILLGTAFKMMHWPFAGMMIVLGYSSMAMLIMFFSVFLYRDKSRSGIFRMAVRIGGLGLALACIGALFRIQHWPNGNMTFIIGIAGVLISVVFFAISQTRPQDKIGFRSIIPVLALIAVMLIGLMGKRDNARIILGMINRLDQEIKAEDLCDLKPDQHEFDSLTDRTDSIKREELYNTGLELRNEIGAIYAEVMSHVTGWPVEDCDTIHVLKSAGPGGDTIYTLFFELENYDIPSFYLVGSDPANPTGKGLELQERLYKFYKSLHEISKAEKPDIPYHSLWAVHEFYNQPLGEVLIRLKQLQIQICQDLNTLK